jgi:hypothetical protein
MLKHCGKRGFSFAASCEKLFINFARFSRQLSATANTISSEFAKKSYQEKDLAKIWISQHSARNLPGQKLIDGSLMIRLPRSQGHLRKMRLIGRIWKRLRFQTEAGSRLIGNAPSPFHPGNFRCKIGAPVDPYILPSGVHS